MVGIKTDGEIIGTLKSVKQKILDILLSIVPSLKVVINSVIIDKKESVVIVPKNPKNIYFL